MTTILVRRAAGAPGTVLLEGEPGYDTTNDDLYVGNGVGSAATLIGGGSLAGDYLAIDGSNASGNIDIGVHSFEAGLLTDGTLTIAGGNITTGGQITCGDIDADNYAILERLSDTLAPYFDFHRKRDGDPTDDVADDDELGRVLFSGFHTDGYDLGAEIRAAVDGTPGNGDMPTRLEFLVSPDGSATPVLAMTIDSAGNIDAADGDITTTGTGTFNIVKATGNGTIWSDGTTGTTPTSGAGTRLMWIPAKAAFRAGSVNGTQWDNANIGTNSHVLGINSLANGSGALAFGTTCHSHGTYSVAIGATANADANNSVAIGPSPTAGGTGSVAIGQNAKTIYYYQTAIGGWVNCVGNYAGALAIGYNANQNTTSHKANAIGAVAIGYASSGKTLTATGTGSCALGKDVNATAASASAIGDDFTNSTASSLGIGFGQLDYLFTATDADFYDSNLTTTGTITGGGAKCQMTPIGGIAVKLTNKTGAASVAGQLVQADSANNDAVVLAAAGDVDPAPFKSSLKKAESLLLKAFPNLKLVSQ